MLKVFRDNLKNLKWVLWGVVIVFVLLVFVDYGRAGRPGTAGAPNVAATVGSQEIPMREFQRQYARLENQYRNRFGQTFTQEMANQLGLPRQVLEGLVAQRILLAEASRLGLEATDEDLRQTILETPGDQTGGFAFQDENGRFIGNEAYRNTLLANQYTVEEFETGVRHEILLGKLNALLSETVYVSPAEVEKTSREQAERASIRYLQVSADPFKAEVSVDQQELEEYFAAHAQDYRVPETRVVNYLAMRVQDFRLSLEIPEEDMRAYYDEHEDQFTQEEQYRARHIQLWADEERTADEARAQLEDLRRQIEGGADFAELAREFSEDITTKDRGGDLSFRRRGGMHPAFEEAVFSTAVGELVGPVETTPANRSAFHLIEVLDRRAGGLQPYEETQPVIQNLLLNERSREAAEAKARELFQRIQGEGLNAADQLRTLAELEGVGFEVTEPFARDGNITQIGRDTAFSVSAFELPVGQVGAPVRVPNGWALPLVTEIIDPRVPEFSEVEEEVREAVIAEKALEVARQRVETARSDLDAGKSLDDVAAELGVSVQESDEFGASATLPGLDSKEVVEAALALETGDFGGPFEAPNGSVLFEVLDRKHWDPVEFEQTKEETRQLLEQQRLGRLQASLIEERRLELEVHYNPQLVQNLQLDSGLQ